VPFTLVHTGKYRTEEEFKKQHTHTLNTTQKKNKQCKTQQNSMTQKYEYVQEKSKYD